MLVSSAQRDALKENLISPIFDAIFEALGKDIARVEEFLNKICHPEISGQVFDLAIKDLKAMHSSFGITVEQLRQMVNPKREEIQWFFGLGDPRTNLYDFRALVNDLIADMLREAATLTEKDASSMTNVSDEESTDDPENAPLTNQTLQVFSNFLAQPDLNQAVQHYREHAANLESQRVDENDSNMSNAIVAEIIFANPREALVGFVEKFHKLPADNKKDKKFLLKRIKRLLIELQKRQELVPTQPKVNLNGMNFSHMDLSDIDFSEMSLEECDFEGAVLNRCEFTKALLCQSNFYCAEMNEVSFAHADLTGATLRKLKRFYIEDANSAEDVILQGAALDGTTLAVLIPLARELSGDGRPLFRLDEIDLSDQNLASFDLGGVYLKKVNFQNAQLENATFKDADVSDSDFRGATGLTRRMFAEMAQICWRSLPPFFNESAHDHPYVGSTAAAITDARPRHAVFTRLARLFR